MPVFGSATADTSASARLLHPGVILVWNEGFPTLMEQPLPVPLHAVSVHPRALVAVVREVPPTAVTYLPVAGYDAPKLLSPVLAVIATPGWWKYAASEL